MSQVKRHIPILDLSEEIDAHWDEFNAAIQGVIRSGRFILGPNVSDFEKEFAAYLGCKHAIGVSSGTDALLVALRAMNIGEGDEVITSPFTFIATAGAITHCGATPVFVDIEPDTFNLDVTQIEAKLTSRTKAILPVHLFGHAAAMDPILDLAQRHKLLVLEDVAQALGGTYRRRKLGTIGAMAAFSFFPTKNLGGFGDAGMIATNDDALADTAKMLRVHGSRQRYYHEAHGYNARLDELQAAILRVKLPHLEASNDRRRAAAERYTRQLKEIPGVRTPVEQPDVKHVYHQYTIRVDANRRDAIHKYLNEHGVGAMIYYPVPLHQQKVYRDTSVSLPRTELAAGEVISLPMGPGLKDDIVDEVVDRLRDAVHHAG